MVLQRNNQAVTRDQLFRLGAAQICALAESDDGSERLTIFLITERTLVQGLFGPSKVIDGELPFHRVRFSFALRQLLGVVIDIIKIILTSAPPRNGDQTHVEAAIFGNGRSHFGVHALLCTCSKAFLSYEFAQRLLVVIGIVA